MESVESVDTSLNTGAGGTDTSTGLTKLLSTLDLAVTPEKPLQLTFSSNGRVVRPELERGPDSSQPELGRSPDSSQPELGKRPNPLLKSHHLDLEKSPDSSPQTGLKKSAGSSSQTKLEKSPNSSFQTGLEKNPDSSPQTGLKKSPGSSSQTKLEKSPDSSSLTRLEKSPNLSLQMGLEKSPDPSSQTGLKKGPDSPPQSAGATAGATQDKRRSVIEKVNGGVAASQILRGPQTKGHAKADAPKLGGEEQPVKQKEKCASGGTSRIASSQKNRKSSKSATGRGTSPEEGILIRKTFGRYQCTYCTHRWQSANSGYNKMQLCGKCYAYGYEQHVFPHVTIIHNVQWRCGAGHHDSQLCEMCRELRRSCTEVSSALLNVVEQIYREPKRTKKEECKKAK